MSYNVWSSWTNSAQIQQRKGEVMKQNVTWTGKMVEKIDRRSGKVEQKRESGSQLGWRLLAAEGGAQFLGRTDRNGRSF